MLKYKIDILEELKEKGYTSYKLRKDKIMGEAQIQKIRNGEIASKETLNTICKLLQCQPGDILEYIEDITEQHTLVSCVYYALFLSVYFVNHCQQAYTCIKCIIDLNKGNTGLHNRRSSIWQA